MSTARPSLPDDHPRAGAANPLRPAAAEYAATALAGHWRAGIAVVRALLDDGFGLLDVYTDVLAEALYEIGRGFDRGRVSVREMHVAASVTDYVLDRLYADFPLDRAGRGTAVVACAPGEAHQVGAHVVADALELDGWNVCFLGANASAAAVLAAVESEGAALVGLSATRAAAAAAAGQVIEAVRSRLGADTPGVLVGGWAFRSDPALWIEVGADGWAFDARAVAEAARAVV